MTARQRHGDDSGAIGESGPRKRINRPLALGAVVLVAGLLAASGWWFGSALPAQQAALAQEREQASSKAAEDAAAKQKADDKAAFWAEVEADNKAKSEQSARDRAAFQASQEDGKAADVQRQMESDGWEHYKDDLYFQYAGDSEFTCGYFKCTYIHVTTLAPNGCPGGMYVAASVEKGTSSIGLANELTAPLASQKVAIVKFEDFTNHADGFQLTTMNCHRG